MNQIKRAKSRLIASFLLPVGILIAGTASGAQSLTPSVDANTTSTVKASNPELDNADTKVNETKERLDVARKQLSTAKAMVKAAEAEFKAAKAARDAIALRENAQQLADASGFPTANAQDGTKTIIVPTNGGSRLTPVDLNKTQTAPVTPPVTPVPLIPAAGAQSLPFNSQPSAAAPAPVENDLRPSMSVNEPNSVP
ncbi:MAG TPA: hypothetical protein V6C81_00570 [Planktothrix sp.]|jgi:hypothetical protein